MSDGFRRAELPGGLVVLTEAMPGIRSASLGVWVRAGSVHEARADMGASHLLEHMVFKGTQQRTARDLALVLERLGGSLDAYTTREHTSFQARVLDADIDIALDVLADLVLNPLLRAEDLELEREVVLEEIATVEDTPDDLVFDLHSELLWGGHPYGYSILGTPGTVSSLSAADLRRVYDDRYHTSNFVIAAAGNIDHDSFVERVRSTFDGSRQSGRRQDPPPPLPDAPAPSRSSVQRATAQSHLVWGRPTFGHGDARRIPMVLLSNAFGGGMSSRLFQRVREELGLAYSVYAYQSFYGDAGISGVYVGTRPEWAERAEEVVDAELARLAAAGLTAEELDDVKGQVKGQIVLSLESSSARLHRLAGTELYGEPFRTMDEITQLVDAVTLDVAAALAAEYFSPAQQTLLRLGPAT
ncbi:MAG: pitrilysin family protein [Gemmatimonadota bacterium]